MSRKHQLRALLSGGELSSTREMARRTGLSQATVSRELSRMPDAVLIGAGRGARFGLLRQIGLHGDRWPMYRVTESGEVEKLGILRALAGDKWLVELEAEDPVYSRGLKRGISEGWPWFLDELRPQGFMGRAFAQRHHRHLGAPADLNLWGSDQFLLASYLFGEDLPGNLMVGEHPISVPETVPETEWPELARESVKGRPPGSSAGGERPKFSVGLELVKFARRDDRQSRWADLLIAEATAGEILGENGIPSAASRIVEVDNFVFLAVRRFDRTTSGGRVGVHSLAAIDGFLYGEGSGSWADMAERLYRDGFLSRADRESIRKVWDFGRAIGNTDMHFGNLGFHPCPDGRFTLAPVYDMLPMKYAPNAAGLPEYEQGTTPVPAIRGTSMAEDFWERLSLDGRLSESFRNLARLHWRDPF